MAQSAQQVPGSGQAPAQGSVTGQHQVAGAFGDFSSPGPVRSAWPATFSGSAGLLSVDRAALHRVAGAMRSDIAHIQAVLADLQQNGLITELEVGGWDAAAGLAAATRNAFAGITSFVNDLIDAHAAVSERITKSALLYEDTEANNTSLSHRAGA